MYLMTPACVHTYRVWGHPVLELGGADFLFLVSTSEWSGTGCVHNVVVVVLWPWRGFIYFPPNALRPTVYSLVHL